MVNHPNPKSLHFLTESFEIFDKNPIIPFPQGGGDDGSQEEQG